MKASLETRKTIIVAIRDYSGTVGINSLDCSEIGLIHTYGQKAVLVSCDVFELRLFSKLQADELEEFFQHLENNKEWNYPTFEAECKEYCMLDHKYVVCLSNGFVYKQVVKNNCIKTLKALG